MMELLRVGYPESLVLIWSTDGKIVSNFLGLGGIAIDILRRCHESDGVIWMCRRQDKKGSVWFFPSGRRYPVDER